MQNSTCGSPTAAALIFAVNHFVEIALSQDYLLRKQLAKSC